MHTTKNQNQMKLIRHNGTITQSKVIYRRHGDMAYSIIYVDEPMEDDKNNIKLEGSEVPLSVIGKGRGRVAHGDNSELAKIVGTIMI